VILRDLAEVMRQCVPTSARAFRFGGDEFAIILPRSDLATAVQAAEGVRVSAARLGLCTLSVGVASMTLQDIDVDGTVLRERADAALYDAKGRGRDAVVGFSPDESTAMMFPLAKIESCRALIDDKAIAVAFQPIWRLDGASIVGFEAIARPEDETLDPIETFRIAERIGRAHELDAICQNVVRSRVAELPPGVLLFINLSPHTLVHPSFSALSFASAYEEANLSPRRVVVEVTEQTKVPVGLLAENLTRLKHRGFKIALDNVGSGNAGLEMLRGIPVEYVKVDRSVIASATGASAGKAVLMAIIAFAAEAGAYVVAEGIDQVSMLDLVQSVSSEDGRRTPLKIDAVQGFLLGRPSGVVDLAAPERLLSRAIDRAA
jgi:EAL domain-containing protein (putative c-di-GMP-specific phosphodiesterase class I)